MAIISLATHQSGHEDLISLHVITCKHTQLNINGGMNIYEESQFGCCVSLAESSWLSCAAGDIAWLMSTQAWLPAVDTREPPAMCCQKDHIYNITRCSDELRGVGVLVAVIGTKRCAHPHTPTGAHPTLWHSFRMCLPHPLTDCQSYSLPQRHRQNQPRFVKIAMRPWRLG